MEPVAESIRMGGVCLGAGGDAPNARFGLYRFGRDQALRTASRHARPSERVVFAHSCHSVTGTRTVLTGLLAPRVAGRNEAGRNEVKCGTWRGGPARGSRPALSGCVAGWLPSECVGGGEPAAQFVIEVGGCGDADAVSEQRVELGRRL